MYVTLRQLTYFQALAKEGNFGRAALACRVSQPALSMQPFQIPPPAMGLPCPACAQQTRSLSHTTPAMQTQQQQQ